MINKLQYMTKDKIFDAINYTFLSLLSLSIIFPFLNLLAQSFDEIGNVTLEGIYLWPKKWTLDNYKMIISTKYIWVGYYNTLIRTIIGTVLSVLISAMGANTLAKKRMPNRTFWTLFLIFTMFFSGGLIPTYLTINSYGLIDNRLVLILPTLVSAYYIVLIRNFFQSLPNSIEESAKIDGATDYQVFFKIVLPLSKPILATVSLWVAVFHWNSWFDCLIYMRNPEKFVLQVILHRIITQGTQQMILGSESMSRDFESRPETIKAATIFVTTVPILCVYPFMQKYFAKGIMVGSLKG